jgi:hypothetical protein
MDCEELGAVARAISIEGMPLRPPTCIGDGSVGTKQMAGKTTNQTRADWFAYLESVIHGLGFGITTTPRGRPKFESRIC